MIAGAIVSGLATRAAAVENIGGATSTGPAIQQHRNTYCCAHYDVFIVEGGQVKRKFKPLDNPDWSEWDNLGAPAGQSFIGKPAVVGLKTIFNAPQIHDEWTSEILVFARNTNQRLFYARLNPASIVPVEWIDLGGVHPREPTPVLRDPANRIVELFLEGTDHSLYGKTIDLSGPSPVYGPSQSGYWYFPNSIQGPISVVATPDLGVRVAGRYLNSTSAWERDWNPTLGWSGWITLAPSTIEPILGPNGYAITQNVSGDVTATHLTGFIDNATISGINFVPETVRSSICPPTSLGYYSYRKILVAGRTTANTVVVASRYLNNDVNGGTPKPWTVQSINADIDQLDILCSEQVNPYNTQAYFTAENQEKAMLAGRKIPPLYSWPPSTQEQNVKTYTMTAGTFQ